MRTLRMLIQKNNTVKIVTILVLAVLVLWSICSIQANAAERAENDKTEYQLQESQFKSEIRTCLEEMGYNNSGITMTKVMDADGSREYTVLVHHQDLDTDDFENVDEIYGILSQIQMPGENMTVNYTIF